MSENVYKRLNCIAAICTIFVVFIHSDNMIQYDISGKTGEIPLFVEGIVAPAIINVAVPIFYFISGILFFRNYSWGKVLPKYKSRLKSVVIPYLIWNSMYTLVAIFFSINSIGRFMNDTWKMLPISTENIINGVFFHKYLPVFWLILHLILFIILSPAIYFFIRNKRFGIIFIIIYWILLSLLINYVSCDFLLYTIGGYISIHHKSVLQRDSYSRKECLMAILCLLCLIMIRVILNIRDIDELATITVFFTIVYFMSLYIVFTCIKQINLSIIDTIDKYQFFIYSTHLFILSIIKKSVRIIFPDTPIVALIAYLSLPIFTITISCIIGNVMNNKVPKLYKILVGGR